MSAFEWNKVIGAVLVVLLFIKLVDIAGSAIVEPEFPKKKAYPIEGVAQANTAAPAAKEKKPEITPIAPLLVKASAADGKKIARKCAICHNFQEGKGAKVGPDLWGVVGRNIAAKADFDYSSGLKSLKGSWTYEKLNHWLFDPKAYVSGTKMIFPGIKKDKDRADVIAFLRTLSDHPEPLPKVTEQPAKAAPAKEASAAPAGASGNAAAQGAAASGLPPLKPLLAKANVAEGKKEARKCAMCHNLKEGQGPKVGPDLWDVVGRNVASESAFNYSSALKSVKGKWTYQKLNEWLHAPQKFVPGTKMAFPGVKDDQKRADVIAYLRTLSDNPQPLP